MNLSRVAFCGLGCAAALLLTISGGGCKAVPDPAPSAGLVWHRFHASFSLCVGPRLRPLPLFSTVWFGSRSPAAAPPAAVAVVQTGRPPRKPALVPAPSSSHR